MSTTRISVSAEELSTLYTGEYCGTVVLALLVYDWLLCLDDEVRFIWNWRSRGVTISSLVYALSRYAWLIQTACAAVTAYPMSDLSCRVDLFAQTIVAIPGLAAFSTFSALRAYALSNRSMLLVITIILLALAPVVIIIAEQIHIAPMNLPSPLNCTNSGSLPPAFSVSGPVVARVSQLMAELLVVGITWWYTYQSYRIRRGVTIGKTIGSLLFYNGSMYFLSFATLYILDITLNQSPLPVEVLKVASLFDSFIDCITSILTCRFMLSLRKFDSTIASMTNSGLGPHFRGHVASTVLEFAAQPSDSLPAFMASFAHPVHVDSDLLEADLDAFANNGSEAQEINAVIPTPEVPSHQSPISQPGQVPELAESV